MFKLTTLIKEKQCPGSEFTVETLQSEIISVCMKQWRTFKASNRNKRIVIDSGVKIFDMLVKYKPSQKMTLQATQRQVVSKNVEVIAEFVNNLPSELRE